MDDKQNVNQGDGKSTSSGGNSSTQNQVSFLPVKIKMLLDMYDDEDDDSEEENEEDDQPSDEHDYNEIENELSKESDTLEQSDLSKEANFQDESGPLAPFETLKRFTRSEKVAAKPLETLKHSEPLRSNQFNYHLDYHPKGHTSEPAATVSSVGKTYTSAPSANFNWQYLERASAPSDVSNPPEMKATTSSFTSDITKIPFERLKSEPNLPTEATQHKSYDQGQSFDSGLPKGRVHSFDTQNRGLSFDSSSSSLKNDKSILSYGIKRTNSEDSDRSRSLADNHLHGTASYKPSVHYSQRSHIGEGSNPRETFHKHHAVPSTSRPYTSTSHRKVFQTSHAKGYPDALKPIEQTPASIQPSWEQNTLRHIPGADQDGKTPGKYMTPMSEDAWRRSGAKPIRRPLAETVPSGHRPTNPYPDSALHKATVLSSLTDRQALGVVSQGKDCQTLTKENLCPSNVEVSSRRQETYPAPSHQKSTDLQTATKAEIQASIPSTITTYQYGKKLSIKGREYIILGILGQGMSGEVYRVQDLSNFELKAIKYVNLAKMDYEAAQSCLNEIKMLHNLQAPTVVKMFDHDVRSQSIYVVMEMGDTDLSRFLKLMSAEKRKLPLTMILYYWTEMLTAVKHIHDNGVIHSDLKPANFLLVRGRLKLIDFGISSTLNAEMTSVVKNTTVGTLNYISPEALMDISGGDSAHQSTKYKISYKSDVWSLGCILYSLVFGNTPFHSIRQQWAKIHAITNPNLRISFALPANAEEVPIVLIDVIKKCLFHDPKARPSVEELLQVQYISVAKRVMTTLPDISSNILMKIKGNLDDNEWNAFIEVLAKYRHH